MASRKQTSTHNRYLKARLRILARPEFWVSAFGLCLVLTFAWQYFTNLEWLIAVQNNKSQIFNSNEESSNSNLSSQEDDAIAVDIDTSSVLKNDLSQNTEVASDNLLAPQSQNTKTEGLFDTVNQQQAESKSVQIPSIPTPKLKQQQTFVNPFITSSAQELLNAGYLGMERQSEGLQFVSNQSSDSMSAPQAIAGSDKVNSNKQKQNNPPISGLQAAINQLEQGNSTTSETQSQTPTDTAAQITPASNVNGQITQPQTVSVPNSPSSTIPQNQTIPSPVNSYNNNSYLYLTQPQRLPVAPAPAPITPNTATTNNVVTSPFQSSIQPSQLNNYGVNSNAGNAGIQLNQINQPNFSAPRPIPGRYIGGGQINTFSNP